MAADGLSVEVGDVLFQVSGLGKLSFCNHRRDKGMMDLLYGCGWFVG